jgi:hypothetical protein
VDTIFLYRVSVENRKNMQPVIRVKPRQRRRNRWGLGSKPQRYKANVERKF